LAKSSWKFLKTDISQIYLYTKEVKLLDDEKGYKRLNLNNNDLIINNINYTFNYKFNLGNYYVTKKFSEYCIGLKGKEFLKFCKPFNYISKKKKK
jgi:hypothetical protein